MADPSSAQTASRSALLTLQEEQRLVRDGYEFLDEKRILLATEMLQQRAAYREARERFMALCTAADAALFAAAASRGLQCLQVYPVPTLAGGTLEATGRPFIGLTMLSAELSYDAEPPAREPVLPSPDVRACRDAYVEVLQAAAPLAAIAANLQRLLHEYHRTERRVRALENVVLPEIRDAMRTMQEHLDLNEQEEAVRVRSARRGGADGPAGG